MSEAGVLLLATDPGADPRWTGLVRAYVARPQAQPVTVLGHAALAEALRGAGVRAERCESPAGPLWRRTWSLLKALRRAAPPSGFAVIAADSDAEHYAALLYRAFSRHPVAVLKTRFGGPLPRSRWNRWVHCKLTGVNLLWSREDEARHRAGGPGQLFLDRPYVLTQPHLGEASPVLMLEHAVNGLTRPTRESLTGVKRDHSHIGLTYVTHFYLNQKSTATIFELLKKYATYDPAVLDRVHFVVVDDGSPLAYEIPALGLNLTWLKVRRDIPWNQSGARNLGVTYAKSDKILITDVDHEFPEATLRHLVEHANCGRRVYKFFRYTPEQPGKLVRGHPNTFFLSRARYFELHGYDEEFAGGYGAEDFRFMKFQKVNGSSSPHLPRRYFTIEREKIDRKTAYHSLHRDHSFNTPADLRKQYEAQCHGEGAGHSRMFLEFEWDVLARQQREVTTTWPVRRWWKRLWWLRAILPRW